MKKLWTLLVMTLTLCALMTGCGGSKGRAEQDVDLTAFYNTLAEEYGWSDETMMDLDGEMLEMYYPGLGEVSADVCIAKAPILSYAVSEYVFLHCGSTQDAEAAAEIMQGRIDAQSGGDAWYPETVDQWKAAKVITHGSYTALIASGEHQADIEAAWDALFAS